LPPLLPVENGKHLKEYRYRVRNRIKKDGNANETLKLAEFKVLKTLMITRGIHVDLNGFCKPFTFKSNTNNDDMKFEFVI
jgi:hypothetical protein